ncbi:YopX protein [Bacillus cereus]|uniref:YopX family protein n=1 Tax=Bacillus cereus group sp. BfR-BA-01317 TaxID=2920294 RepID=UPI000A301247|nr:YopX family protein [Bacillus cereus group sp. BfR-BA-01317]SME50798.1 YopX protein [Bacillus cereus]
MREIKFRAWDKEKQFMFIPTQIELEQGENLGKWDSWRPMAWRDELPEEGSGGIGRTLGDECELMQYTDLKDKNGKEIYEGDILQFNTDAPGVVDWFRGSWRVKTPPNYNGDDWRTSLWDATVDGYEIIGNIHENPELLKTK